MFWNARIFSDVFFPWKILVFSNFFFEYWNLKVFSFDTRYFLLQYHFRLFSFKKHVHVQQRRGGGGLKSLAVAPLYLFFILASFNSKSSKITGTSGSLKVSIKIFWNIEARNLKLDLFLVCNSLDNGNLNSINKTKILNIEVWYNDDNHCWTFEICHYAW